MSVMRLCCLMRKITRLSLVNDRWCFRKAILVSSGDVVINSKRVVVYG